MALTSRTNQSNPTHAIEKIDKDTISKIKEKDIKKDFQKKTDIIVNIMHTHFISYFDR